MKELAGARFRIYINSDLWTSLNSLPIIGIVTHYLNKDLINKNTLISMRRVKGAYNSENITEVMIPVLEKIRIVSRLEYFIENNAGPNDIC
jgi:glucose-6-phosphate 1-dehydrogenase